MNSKVLKRSPWRKGMWKHGLSQTPEYRTWYGMLARCENPKHSAYKYYGARGIEVCDRWHKFENFLEDMGPRPSDLHSIDRINGKGGYWPGNCRWATQAVQSKNKVNWDAKRRSA